MRVYSASGLPIIGNYVPGNTQSFIHCSGITNEIYYATPMQENCTALSAVTPAGSGIRVNMFITPNYPIILNDVCVQVTATPVGVPEYWITLGIYENIDARTTTSELKLVLYPGDLIAQSKEIPVTTQGKISWYPNIKLEPNKRYWLAYLPSRSSLSVRGSSAGGSIANSTYGISNALGTASNWGISASVVAANATVRATGLPAQFPTGGTAQTSAQPCIFYKALYGGAR